MKPGAKSALIRTVQALEDTMAEQWQSFTSMFTKLAEDLKLPGVDTEKLIEAHRKNIDALARSAEAASEGAKSLAMKQREIVEEAIRETSAMVRDFKLESPQDAAAKQAEFAKKAFEAAVRNTRDVAELVQRSSTDALKIIQDRMQQSFEEIRGTVEKK
jgi:phasin family protein